MGHRSRRRLRAVEGAERQPREAGAARRCRAVHYRCGQLRGDCNGPARGTGQRASAIHARAVARYVHRRRRCPVEHEKGGTMTDTVKITITYLTAAIIALASLFLGVWVWLQPPVE